MTRTSRCADMRRSTGWCKLLGGPERAAVDYAAAQNTRVANRAARMTRIDEILGNYEGAGSDYVLMPVRV